MNADMRSAAGRPPREDRFGRSAVELAAELFFDEGNKFLDAHGVEHIFEPRLGAVGAIAVLDEDTDHRVRRFARVLGPDQDPGLARKVEVAGDAAEPELEPDA